MSSSFVIEIWTEYAIAMFVMLLRFATRLRLVGFRNFDATDFFCFVASTFSHAAYYPSNGALDEHSAMALPDADVQLYIPGSKMVHFSWVIYICMVFTFKAVILCWFTRVGLGVWYQDSLIKYTSVFVGLCWVASILAHLCACVPIQRAWQVKPWPGPFCTNRPQNYYVAGILNMVRPPSTDVILLILPIPMLWKLQVNLRLCCTFLRTYFVFSDSLLQATGINWAGREGVVSMLVVSAPGVWPLFRNIKCVKRSNEPQRGVWKPSTILTIGRRRVRSREPDGTTVLDTYTLTSQLEADCHIKPSSTCGSVDPILTCSTEPVADAH
ncbi:hypothetical protein PWT90_00495 [Aphanocladium album]|nr:hypothetical protein PWT90_00495 [Aphanocladium album]